MLRAQGTRHNLPLIQDRPTTLLRFVGSHYPSPARGEESPQQPSIQAKTLRRQFTPEFKQNWKRQSVKVRLLVIFYMASSHALPGFCRVPTRKPVSTTALLVAQKSGAAPLPRDEQHGPLQGSLHQREVPHSPAKQPVGPKACVPVQWRYGEYGIGFECGDKLVLICVWLLSLQRE